MISTKRKLRKTRSLMLASARNSSYRTKLRNAIKLVRINISNYNKVDAMWSFNKLVKTIDIATSKKICQKNKSSRIKRSLFAAIVKLQ